MRTRRRPPPPLDAGRLDELALTYVGRFATTRAKLRSYLSRKIRERGWEGTEAPDVATIAERFAGLGYIDDAAFALSKSRSLGTRGYGPRRVHESLRAAGIEEEDAGAARALAAGGAVDAALRFAERRRLGPFGKKELDPKERQRALAAMIRAGHGFALARAILTIRPGEELNPDTLAQHSEHGE